MVKKSTTSLPSVDVAIVAYNQEDFIEEAIRSVVEQDYENLKVYVADDCSTDNTGEIINELTHEFPNKVFHLRSAKNKGITKNANLGIKSGTGDFVVGMGGDDVLLPGKISKQVDWFQKNKRGVLCGHKTYTCNSNSEITGVYSKKLKKGKGLKEWLRYGTIFIPLSIMLKRSAMPDYGFDERLILSSDWKLSIDTLKNGGFYGYVDEFLGLYRRHANNITNVYAPLKVDCITSLKLFKEELHPKWHKNIEEGYAFVILYGTGVELMKIGKYKEALTSFKLSIIKWPLNIKAYYRIGTCLPKILFKSV